QLRPRNNNPCVGDPLHVSSVGFSSPRQASLLTLPPHWKCVAASLRPSCSSPQPETRATPSQGDIKMADSGPSTTSAQLPPPPQPNAGAPGYENSQNTGSNPSHMP